MFSISSWFSLGRTYLSKTLSISSCCCSVAQSCPTLWDPMDCSMSSFSVLHHLLELAQTHVHWAGDDIQPSHSLSSPSPPTFYPASASFPVNWLFISGSQSIGVSASASVLMNIQVWFPLGLTGLIFLQSKGFSRVFSNTTAPKYKFFGTQPYLSSIFHIHTWLLEKP